MSASTKPPRAVAAKHHRALHILIVGRCPRRSTKRATPPPPLRYWIQATPNLHSHCHCRADWRGAHCCWCGNSADAAGKEEEQAQGYELWVESCIPDLD